jgi:hypothetical protein
MLAGMFDKPLPAASETENRLVKEIRETFRDLTGSNTQHSGLCHTEGQENIARLRELVLNDDPRRFMRWDVILKTMSVAQAEYVRPEFNYLKNLADWDSRWRSAIDESPVGHPEPYWRYPRSSGNLIHHAYHLARFEKETSLCAHTMDFIFEFGGGYGNMCRLLHKLGFQGSYVLFDLPAFSALQKFYLESVGITVRLVDSFEKEKKGCFCISDIRQLKRIFSAGETSSSIFIATWSISETPLELRNNVLSCVKNFGTFLIAYQHRFKEVDNIGFFRKWTAAQKDVLWYNMQIEHIPNNSYLFGKSKIS